MRRHQPRALSTILLITVAVACGSNDEDGATTPATSSTTTVTSALASSTPTTEESSALRTLPASGPLEPGEYRTSVFQPALSFGLGPNWSALFYEAEDNFAVFYDLPLAASVTDLKSVGVVRLTNTFDDPFLPGAILGGGQPGKADHIVPVPADLVAWLRAIPGVAVGEPQRLEVGGHEAIRFDVSYGLFPVQARQTCPSVEGLEGKGCLALLSVEADAEVLTVFEGSQERWTVVSAGDDRVAISFGASAAEFEAFASVVQPVVDAVKLD